MTLGSEKQASLFAREDEFITTRLYMEVFVLVDNVHFRAVTED